MKTMPIKRTTHYFDFEKDLVEVTEYPFDPFMEGDVKISLKGHVFPEFFEYPDLNLDELSLVTADGINIIIQVEEGFLALLKDELLKKEQNQTSLFL